MDTLENTPSYVGTSYAAKMLGVSVGTIQKLVDAGRLSAHTTQGKHRRIHMDSLIQYCADYAIPIPVKPSENQAHLAIALLQNDPLLNHHLHNSSIHWIFSPFDLMGLNKGVRFLLLDARLSWLSWRDVGHYSIHKLARKIIVCSAHACPASIRKDLANQLMFVDQDLSNELINGFCLGLETSSMANS